jgi:hypothetical protein
VSLLVRLSVLVGVLATVSFMVVALTAEAAVTTGFGTVIGVGALLDLSVTNVWKARSRHGH